MPQRHGIAHHNAREPEWVVEAARRLREEGWTYRAIGELLEVPWRTVADWVQYRTRTRISHKGES